MAPRVLKAKRKLHEQHVDPVLAIGFLVVLALLVGAYLVANFKYSLAPEGMSAGSTAATVTSGPAPLKNKSEMASFASSDDFKSYLDDGLRAYGDGIFEAQTNAVADASSQSVSTGTNKAISKNVLKNQKNPIDTAISSSDAKKFFSPGQAGNGLGPDIIVANRKNVFFSPNNQFYLPSPATNAIGVDGGNNQSDGETMVFDAVPAESFAQISSLPHDGNILVSGNTLEVISNGSIFAYDISDISVPREVWRAGIGDGTSVIDAKTNGAQLYLTLKTKIDSANPCPIKPLIFGEKPFLIECASIYHPARPILADSIFSVVLIDLASGKALKNLSFVGADSGSAIMNADNFVYAFWGQQGDYVDFFVNFLQDECKSLLPNYLLEKAVRLPDYNIALASKEFELRALLSNWFATLDQDEQTRVSGQINDRLGAYLRDHAEDFEQTGIATANIDSFKFATQAQVSGRVYDTSMIDVRDGNLRIVTAAGQGLAQKMAWLVTGKVSIGQVEKTLDNVYVLDDNLSIVGSRTDLYLPSGICAVQFDSNRAYASTCRSDNPFYAIGLAAPFEIGLAGTLNADPATYLRPLDDGSLLEISKNGRKAKIAIIDDSLPANPILVSEYDINDYWADIDANYQAFSIDGKTKLFFVPDARGGYVFSYNDNQIALQKNVGDISVSRSLFIDGNLYLAGDGGIEIYGGTDWAKIKSVKF